ncbi:hypothetical protein [Georgenia wangjunii]|uniref:hypothetical protein n=1 Tax=Georgenia wangjunii TaxID=3117730 RepID=UPI002F26C648
MSMMEPLLPGPKTDETIAAADPGSGGPAPAPGFGIAGEDPDRAERQAEDPPTDGDAFSPPVAEGEIPFRTPDPQVVRRPSATGPETST